MRFLKSPLQADKTIPKIPPVHLFIFPVECVKEVIFGLKMTDEKKQEIGDIVKAKYPDANLYQATEHDTEFALEIKPVV